MIDLRVTLWFNTSEGLAVLIRILPATPLIHVSILYSTGGKRRIEDIHDITHSLIFLEDRITILTTFTSTFLSVRDDQMWQLLVMHITRELMQGNRCPCRDSKPQHAGNVGSIMKSVVFRISTICQCLSTTILIMIVTLTCMSLT
jgi:hypothetical protein